MDKKIDLFVPGRVCILGEHSDWASNYRRINSDISKGCAIVTGTNQGLYAKAQLTDDHIFHFRSQDENGETVDIHLQMDEKKLLKEAHQGGFSSYVAGVAYQLLVHYNVGGLYIDNYKTTLPIKKGLSSSAAVCVLVTRAFNQLYSLNMSIRGEMEFAYKGELTTPSRCGRLDQGCAYGNSIISMEFDSDSIDVKELYVGSELNFVIADLKAGKDTVRILSDLNKAFPFPQNKLEENVVFFLGQENKRINDKAQNYIERGDKKALGKLMVQSQVLFDKYVSPACPSELIAPKLHQLLLDENLVNLSLGMKGVGSQGDGSIQFLVEDKQTQKMLINYLNEQYNLEGMSLDVPKTKKVKKAIITAAGFGTRLFPQTLFSRKELLPVVDKGQLKPLILNHIENCFKAGIEDVYIIINQNDTQMMNLFENINLNSFKEKYKDNDYYNYLSKMKDSIHFVYQDEAKGLGHAILQAKSAIGNETFLLILGDHHFVRGIELDIIKDILNMHELKDCSVIGLSKTSLDDVSRFGCIDGKIINNNLVHLNSAIEKPKTEFADKNLLKIDGNFLSFLGIYLFMPTIFQKLEELYYKLIDNESELQLTDAIDELINKELFLGLISEIVKLDLGTPAEYINYFKSLDL